MWDGATLRCRCLRTSKCFVLYICWTVCLAKQSQSLRVIAGAARYGYEAWALSCPPQGWNIAGCVPCASSCKTGTGTRVNLLSHYVPGDLKAPVTDWRRSKRCQPMVTCGPIPRQPALDRSWPGESLMPALPALLAKCLVTRNGHCSIWEALVTMHGAANYRTGFDMKYLHVGGHHLGSPVASWTDTFRYIVVAPGVQLVRRRIIRSQTADPQFRM